MKKIVVLFLIAGFSTIVSGQTITRNIGDFTSIKVFDRISVQLIPATETKVEITGERAEEVQLVNSNGELRIRMPLKKLLQGETIEMKVYYKKIDTIEASEGSFVVSETPIEGISFTVNGKEGAEIQLDLKVQKASIKLNSGAVLSIKGTTENQEIIITTGGEMKGEHFQSKQTTITVNAGGSARIFATDFVEAKVRAGGDIYIHGSPAEISQKTVLGGTIIEVKR